MTEHLLKAGWPRRHRFTCASHVAGRDGPWVPPPWAHLRADLQKESISWMKAASGQGVFCSQRVYCQLSELTFSYVSLLILLATLGLVSPGIYQKQFHCFQGPTVRKNSSVQCCRPSCEAVQSKLGAPHQIAACAASPVSSALSSSACLQGKLGFPDVAAERSLVVVVMLLCYVTLIVNLQMLFWVANFTQILFS